MSISSMVVVAAATGAEATPHPITPPPAPAKDGSVPAPASVWSPPTSVDHTTVGGAPPSTTWHGPGTASAGFQTLSTSAGVACNSGVATGVLKPYPLEKFPVSDRTQLMVNTFNGNVVVDTSDLTVKGTGENLSLDHVYNSRLAGNGAIGQGWMLNSGQDVGLTVDGSGNVTLHGESGYCATFTKNSDGSFTPAPGISGDLTAQSGGGWVLTFWGSNEKWTFTAAGWLTTQADRNGNTTTLHYNTNGTLASITDSQARVTTFTYDSAGRLWKITDPTGTDAATYTYDSNGRLQTSVDRDSQPTSFGYDSAGNLTSITDAENQVTSLVYDTSDRVTQITLPGTGTPDTGDGAPTAVTKYSYGTNQTTETDPDNHQATYTYDTQGRQTKATDALGHSQSTTWTTHSDVGSTTDGLNNSTSYQYDTINNLVGTTQPTGAKYTVGYTQSGQPHLPSTVTDPQANVVTRSYDAAGNVTKVHSNGLNADLQVNTYNPNGTIATSKDGNGNLTSYTYDSAGNLTTVTPPNPRGATHYTYDTLSRITSVTDGNGVRIDYGYDRLDRVVSISHNGQTLEASSYDRIGDLTLRQDVDVAYSYAWAKTNAGSQLITSFREDAAGTQQQNDYNYDGVGNLVEFGDADTDNHYTYDPANRLTALADAFGQTTTFGYDNAGHRTNVTFPGAGTQTNTYDASGRQTGLTVKNTGGATLYNSSWSYTKSGGGDSDLIQSRTLNGATTVYTYDPLQRVTAAGSATFGYDTAGNLTNRSGTPVTVNAANEFTGFGGDTQSFDGAGNLTGVTPQSGASSQVHYSNTNQLTSMTSGGAPILTAGYDTTDQTQPNTITETNAGVTTTHTFVQSALGITKVTDNGVRATYARDPKGTPITEEANSVTGVRYNIITDNQGSVVAMLDTSGNLAASYSYDPYGAITTSGAHAGENYLRWLGTYQLRGGVSLTGYRYYNPTWARFTQPDPTGQEANPYTYAQGNPINQSDPTGASAWENAACGIANTVFFSAYGFPLEALPLSVGAQQAVWWGGVAWGGLSSSIGICAVDLHGQSSVGYDAAVDAP